MKMKMLGWVGGIILLVGILIGIVGAPVVAEGVGDGLTEAYWNGYITDTKSIVLAPLEWESEDWLKASLVAGTTLALIHNDQSIQDCFQNHRTSSTDHLAHFSENFGNPKVVIPALALWYGYGRITGDSKAQEAAALSLEGLSVAGGFTYGLKLLTHRARPYTGDDPDEWEGLNGSFADRNVSFPSAHSAIAFSTATVFAMVYEDKAWVRNVSYTLATCVALSRVNDNEHWSSDVFLGSVLGWYTAKSIVNNHRTAEEPAVTVAPFGIKDGFGLSLKYQF